MTEVQGAIGVTVCGGLATAPLAASVCGWIAHWNAYTNVGLLLGSVALWLTLMYALREASRAAVGRSPNEPPENVAAVGDGQP